MNFRFSILSTKFFLHNFTNFYEYILNRQFEMFGTNHRIDNFHGNDESNHKH